MNINLCLTVVKPPQLVGHNPAFEFRGMSGIDVLPIASATGRCPGTRRIDPCRRGRDNLFERPADETSMYLQAFCMHNFTR